MQKNVYYTFNVGVVLLYFFI